jgi:3-hydroxyisobutyrate dehydrogenase
MGAAMAGRLLAVGESVAVWNRTADKTRALGAAGARVAATPAELSAACDTVISVLTDAAAIDAAYSGACGLLHGNVSGKLFIDMSTVRPLAARALAAAVSARGARFVECPVGGSVGPAREGKLFGFAGGDAADVARARPILERLCRRVEHVGPAGAGASMKLAVNLPMHTYWQALDEALAICRPLGLDAARLVDIFADTSGAPASLKTRKEGIVAALNGADAGPADFDVDSIRKDLRAMLEEARALGVGLPVAERALEFFDRGSREGQGSRGAARLLRRGNRRSPG